MNIEQSFCFYLGVDEMNYSIFPLEMVTIMISLKVDLKWFILFFSDAKYDNYIFPFKDDVKWLYEFSIRRDLKWTLSF